MKNENEIESAAISDRGLSESRPENEDSYLDLADCGIFAVADGVGGEEAGEVASQMAIEILSEAFTNIPDNADPEEVMRSAMVRANESIFQMSSEIPRLSRMATTIAALHLRDDVATIGHVGDSRLYRLDAGRKLVQETDDHSIVADEVRAGRLTQEQAASHPSRNIISRALGAEPSVEVDLKTMMVEPGTSFLLCTDGVTKHVSDDEIRGLLASENSPGDLCGKLKDLCFERGAEDNLTAVVVRFGASDMASSAADESYYPFDDEEPTLTTARDPDYGDRPGPEDDMEIERALNAAWKEPEADDEVEPDDTQSLLVGDQSYAGEDSVSADATERSTASREIHMPALAQPTFSPAVEHPEREFIQERHREIFGNQLGYEYEQPYRQGGGLFRMLGMLALGLLIGGVGAYWLLSGTDQEPPPQAEVPVINEMKSTNIPLTSFEESRRTVDRDPRRFIALNPNPQEAEDYFLLGRAYLLTGEFFLARNAFTAAKERLSEIDERDVQTISNDIEMALAIIGSGTATEAFTRSAIGGSPANSANTVPPTNVVPPLR